LQFSAAIFDLDGTLCDTIGDLRTSMNEMLRTVGFPEVSRETVIASINNGAREFVRGCLPEPVQQDEDKLDRCLAIYKECYSRHYLDTTYAYVGMTELIAELRAAGFRLGVLSNKHDTMVKAIIYKLFGDDAFDDYAVWGQAFLPHKPDPAAAYYLAGVLHVRPDEVAFIGDSHIDISTALNAGMFPVGVSWGYRPAELLIETGAKAICNTPGELRKLLLGK
jgi:phosphoglycolate phosphatase